METRELDDRTLGLPRAIEEVKANYSLEDEKPEKLPWAMTLEEKKERIRRSEEDYEAGRLHTHEEVFGKYL